MKRLDRRNFLGWTGVAAGGTLLGHVFLTIEAIAQENRGMKITAVEPHLVEGGKCFVLVRTSEGITGIGEASPMNSPALVYLIKNTFAPLLKGMNPLEIDRCWEKVYYQTYKQGVMGLQPEALAAVDIALWDILGKATGMPIHQLLGGKRRDWVRVYSSMGGGARSSVAEMVARASKAVSEGFTAVKVRMDYGSKTPDVNVKHDLAMLAAVRKAIGPDVELKYDVNNGYTVDTAIRVGKAIEELGVNHYEEPVAQTDYAGYAKVVDAVNIPVAAGEHEYTRWQFRDLIEQANVDILQPDLVKCAGISEAVRIAALASAHHKLLCPHQTQPTIGQAATLHFTSVFVAGETAQEVESEWLNSPLHKLFKNPLEYKDGRMRVPDGPGLGLDLDETKLKE